MKVYSLVVLLLCIGVISLVGTSCANIVPPSGGPKDTLPPRLLRSEPKDSALNFKARSIVLTFDEYLDLQDVSNNLLFTPTIGDVPPQVDVKLKTITIRFKTQDTLAPNTTYVMNFGNAIKDINEGNVLRNFKYIFSTGPTLDSLSLTGKVIVAETGRIDSTLTVILHKNLADTAVRTRRPDYITRVDRNGSFRFTNLAAGNYAIYALGDAGTLRRYVDTSKLFAFSDSVIHIAAGATPTVQLYAYRTTPENKNQPAATSVKSNDKHLRIQTPLTNTSQDLLANLQLSFDRPLRFWDSTKISFSTDSTYTPVPNYSIVLDSTRKRIGLRTEWKENTKYHLVFDKDFAEDTLGRRLIRNDTLSFATRKVSEYGSLTIRVKNVDPKRNPVLQLLQNDAVVFSVNIASGRYSQKLFSPGEYNLRILYDTNGNGKWDPGRFYGQKRQPELVQNIERKIVIKPNAANEFEVSL